MNKMPVRGIYPYKGRAKGKIQQKSLIAKLPGN